MMTHFRVKLLKLPEACKRYIRRILSPAGRSAVETEPAARPDTEPDGIRIRPLLRNFTIAAPLISSWNLNPVLIVALAAALLVYQVDATKPEMGRG